MLDVQKLSAGQGHKSSPMGISHSRSKDPRVQKVFENKSARISQTHNHHHNHNKNQELAAMRGHLGHLGIQALLKAEIHLCHGPRECSSDGSGLFPTRLQRYSSTVLIIQTESTSWWNDHQITNAWTNLPSP